MSVVGGVQKGWRSWYLASVVTSSGPSAAAQGEQKAQSHQCSECTGCAGYESREVLGSPVAWAACQGGVLSMRSPL